jgi:hypothetical protein
MKNFYKNIVFITLLLLAVISGSSQTGSDCKYLSVLTYIRTNTDINKRIKTFFPWAAKKKEKYVEFNLSDRVDFIGISYFREKIMSDTLKYRISEKLLTSDKEYYNRYFFESFKSEFLRNIVERNSSSLFLTFSKPIDNYLVVELGNFDPGINQKVKYGKGMQMFFLFDESGVITSVLYSGAAYN